MVPERLRLSGKGLSAELAARVARCHGSPRITHGGKFAPRLFPKSFSSVSERTCKVRIHHTGKRASFPLCPNLIGLQGRPNLGGLDSEPDPVFHARALSAVVIVWCKVINLHDTS